MKQKYYLIFGIMAIIGILIISGCVKEISYTENRHSDSIKVEPLVNVIGNELFFNKTRIVNKSEAYVHHGDYQYYLLLEDGTKVTYTKSSHPAAVEQGTTCSAYLRYQDEAKDRSFTDPQCTESVNRIKEFFE